MNKRQRMGVGFIGCGGHCRGCNIPCADQNPNLRITGFCDLNDETLQELEERYRPDFVTNDMERVFAEPEVRMVVCATKPDVRLPVIELAIKYRKPLFIEKPLAYSREDTEKALALMEGVDLPLIVGFNRPYSPMARRAKTIFKRRKKGNATIVYRIVGEGQIWPPSHREAVYDKGESTLVHETTHIFDLLAWLTDSAPTSVYAIGGGNVDNIVAITYPNDTYAVIIAGDNGTVGYPKERLEIDTNFSVIIGDYFVELNAVRCGKDSGREFFAYEMNGETRRDGICGVEEALRVWRDNVTEEQRRIGHYFGQTPSVDKGHYGQLEYFRQRILDGGRVETTAKRGALANFTAWKAQESWKAGRALPCDLAYLMDN